MHGKRTKKVGRGEGRELNYIPRVACHRRRYHQPQVLELEKHAMILSDEA